MPDAQNDPDEIDANALLAACEAEPTVTADQARRIVDAYLATLHIHITRMHTERELTPDEMLDAFAPRTVEF